MKTTVAIALILLYFSDTKSLEFQLQLLLSCLQKGCIAFKGDSILRLEITADGDHGGFSL